jgi:hypothetical protein
MSRKDASRAEGDPRAALTLALIASAITKVAELASCTVRAEADHLVGFVAVTLDEICLPSPRLGI